MIEDHQVKTLMLLYELEKVLSDMYVVFSQEYPEHNVLWKRLIDEEQGHAEAVRSLYKLTYQGQVLFDEGTIKHAGVQSIIDYAKDITESARQKKYTERQAMSHSLDIEKSFIERTLFDHFKVSSEFAALLWTLQQGTESHRELLEEELAELMKKPNPIDKTKPQ